MHDSAPVIANLPGKQVAQAAARKTDDAKPAAHSVQVALATAEYMPAKQVLHTDASIVEYKPAAQLLHNAAPEAEYRPEAQMVQLEVPLDDWNFPTSHSLQITAPAEEYLPGTHASVQALPVSPEISP